MAYRYVAYSSVQIGSQCEKLREIMSAWLASRFNRSIDWGAEVVCSKSDLSLDDSDVVRSNNMAIVAVSKSQLFQFWRLVSAQKFLREDSFSEDQKFIAKRTLNDLVSFIESREIASPAPGFAGFEEVDSFASGWQSFDVLVGGVACFNMVLSPHLLTAWSGLDYQRVHTRPLASFEDAIADSVIDLKARVGSATVSLADLKALKPGDVFQLNESISDHICVINDRGDQVGKAVVGRAGNNLALKFC